MHAMDAFVGALDIAAVGGRMIGTWKWELGKRASIDVVGFF
jgi:hypothetical protein